MVIVHLNLLVSCPPGGLVATSLDPPLEILSQEEVWVGPDNLHFYQTPRWSGTLLLRTTVITGSTTQVQVPALPLTV